MSCKGLRVLDLGGIGFKVQGVMFRVYVYSMASLSGGVITRSYTIWKVGVSQN